MSLRFWFRLYWFPLKVLYATCVSSIHSVPNIPFYFFFNALLFALLLMNIYWFLVRILLVFFLFFCYSNPGGISCLCVSSHTNNTV